MAESTYKVLYRKYRPTCFGEVIGQDIIINTLKSSIQSSNFSHAYVFTGPRGTGKTSTAKIMAKAINCENPIDGEPCGKCKCCQEFSTSPDIIEIDAASNNGVDEIRELRSNVLLAPGASKYKIYIIDEVHMLSAGAFNALLKTLEEPPSHAVFILATTEVYKIPITILSRCQRYDFRKISKPEMINHLNDICKKEKIACDELAFSEIYDLSEGCLRDALSILDQLSKINKKINLDIVLERYNLISDKSIDNLLISTKEGRVQEVVNHIRSFQDSGMNPQKLIKKMINNIEIKCISVKAKERSDYSYSFLKNLIMSLNSIYVDARINENTFSMILLAFLDQISPSDATKSEQPEKPVKKEYTFIEARINNCFASADKKCLQDLVDQWDKSIYSKITDIDISDYKPVAASNEYAIFTSEDESLVNLFNIKHEEIEKKLKKLKIQLKVVAITESCWKEEKEKYKNNRKNGVEYRIVNEPEDVKNEQNELNEIFMDKIIEVS